VRKTQPFKFRKGWQTMQATKMFLETNQYGQLTYQPSFPANIRMEAIFLILEKKNNDKRKPSAKIFQKGRILGDILSPVLSHEDWDV